MFSLNGLAPLRQVSPASSAFMIGHSFGLHGMALRMLATFTADEQDDFQDGWRAGDAERRSEPMEPTDEDLGVYHDGCADGWLDEAGEPHPYPCPPDDFDMATPNDEYYARLAADEEPDAWTMEEWNRKRGIHRGRPVHQVELERFGRTG